MICQRMLRYTSLDVRKIFKYHWCWNVNQGKGIKKCLVTLQTFSVFMFAWPMKKLQSIPETKNNEKTLLLENADHLFENGHYEQCYRLLNAFQDSTDEDIQWRICRVLYNLSKDSNLEIKEKKDLILKAFNILSEPVSKNSDNYAVHKWYALILDAKSTSDGIKARINELENVKKHMDIAVSLNPNDATTLHMLGEWCYQVTDMPWHQRKIAETLFASPPHSTYEDALEYFLRAESVAPRFYSINLLRLGNCYLKLKKEDQAKYYLQLAASYPAKSIDDHTANKEAMELLKKIK